MPVSTPSWFIQSLLHRALRKALLRVSPALVFDSLFVISSALGAIYLTALSLPPGLRYQGYMLLAILAIVLLMRLITRDTKDWRWEVLSGCVRMLHEQVFGSSPNFRLTFFIRDPIALASVQLPGGRTQRDDIIVPLVRIESGQARCVHPRTRAYYPVSSNAVTAEAWRQATGAKDRVRAKDFRSFTSVFPRFGSRPELAAYYEGTLKIDHDLVERISDHMIGVVAILSIPIVNNVGEVLGLLSIDSSEPLRLPDDAAAVVATRVISRDHLGASLEAFRTTLAHVIPSSKY